MGPTGVVAIQIDSTTIHTALGIPVEYFGTKFPLLRDKMKHSLKNHLSDLKGALSGLRQFLANESPLKMMKNAFYFTLISYFVLKIFKFLF